MGLASIKQRLPERTQEECKIDLSRFFDEEEGESVITFREPQAADMFGIASRMTKLKASYPDFPPPLLKQVLILASCYVPDGQDAMGMDPDIVLGSFARDHRDLFLYIDGEFVTKFPIAGLLSADQGNA